MILGLGALAAGFGMLGFLILMAIADPLGALYSAAAWTALLAPLFVIGSVRRRARGRRRAALREEARRSLGLTPLNRR